MYHDPVQADRYVRADELLLWRRVGDEILILPVDADDQELVAVTGTSSVLWDLLAEPVLLTDAIGVLGELHGVEPTEIEGDVRAVVAEMEARGLVRQVSAA